MFYSLINDLLNLLVVCDTLVHMFRVYSASRLMTAGIDCSNHTEIKSG